MREGEEILMAARQLAGKQLGREQQELAMNLIKAAQEVRQKKRSWQKEEERILMSGGECRLSVSAPTGSWTVRRLGLQGQEQTTGLSSDEE